MNPQAKLADQGKRGKMTAEVIGLPKSPQDFLGKRSGARRKKEASALQRLRKNAASRDVEPISGFEPLTYSLRVNRSTD